MGVGEQAGTVVGRGEDCAPARGVCLLGSLTNVWDVMKIS